MGVVTKLARLSGVAEVLWRKERGLGYRKALLRSTLTPVRGWYSLGCSVFDQSSERADMNRCVRSLTLLDCIFPIRDLEACKEVDLCWKASFAILSCLYQERDGHVSAL